MINQPGIPKQYRPDQHLSRFNCLHELLFLVFLAGLVFYLYSNSFNSPFLFDDIDHIHGNPNIRLTSITWENINNAAFISPSKNRPLANLSLALNYYFHQFSLPGYHLVNIFIHLMAGIILYFLLTTTLHLLSVKAGGRVSSWLPVAAVLVWIVHPLHIQSVTYVIQRMNSLAAMFYVLALLCYVRARLAGIMAIKAALFGSSFVACLLAVGAKENAVTLPFFILLYEWFFLQDLRRAWLKKMVLPIIGIGLLLALMVLFYLGFQPLDAVLAGYTGREFTLLERLLTEFRVVVFYISLLLLPHPARLNLEHDFFLSSSLFNPVSTLIALGLLSGLFITAMLIAKRQRFAAFGILWFLGNLVIESTIIPLEIIFEHRTYLPSMMFIPVMVFLGSRIVRNKQMQVATVCLAAVILSMWTYQRNMVWQDELTLMQDSAAKSPDKPRVQANLANALLRTQLYDKAVTHYKKALSLDPQNADQVHFNLGNVYMKQKNYDAAVEQFRTAVSLNPAPLEFRLNLGQALAMQGNIDAAITEMEEVLQFLPENGSVHNNLGIMLMQKGRVASAEYHFSEAVRFGHEPAAANLQRVQQQRARIQRTRPLFLRNPVQRK
jgi:tetratricopeptide (TPR) repeat protein